MTERVIRERLALCGIKRTFLAAQNDRLRRETERALREARQLGSQSLSLTEAARIAGVSRSVAYAKYLSGQEGDASADPAVDGDTVDSAVAERPRQGQPDSLRAG